jgi:hypothetical protein
MTITEMIDELLSELDLNQGGIVKYPWQQHVHTALLHSDPALIAKAETDLYRRRLVLQRSDNANEELKALNAAIQQLQHRWH